MTSDPIDREIALAREAARALTEAPLDPVRRARLWSHIEKAPSAPAPRALAWRWLASGAALAAGLALWAAVGREDLADTAVEQMRRLEVRERFEAEVATDLALTSGVKLRVEPGASVVRSETSRLELSSGAIRLSVEEPAPLTVLTREVRITATNARFSIERTPGRTAVAVQSGRIEWVAALDRGAVRQLVAGTSTTIETKRVEERRAPVAPKPRAAQRPKPRRRIEVARAPAAPEIGAAELMALADEHRREGRAIEAWETYGRAAADGGVGPLLEEALLRQAQLSAELDRHAEGLRLLSEIERRVGQGLLGPERTALAVELHLSLGEVGEAAGALEANRSGALVLDRARIRVAERLLERDPVRARALLEIVLNGSAPRSTLEEAKRLMGEDR